MSISTPVKEKNPSIFIPEGVKRIAVRVRGVTPLLFNPMSGDTFQGLIDRATGRKNKTKPEERTPRQVAAEKVHIDPATNKPCVPANMLMSTLINGGRNIIMEGKKKMSTAKETRVTGFLSFEEMYFLIKPENWEVDIKPGNCENAGKSVAIAVIRPRFDEWQFNLTIQIDTNIITEKEVRYLFDLSLSRIGIGSDRIVNGGTHGKSVIDKWALL